LIDLAVVWLFTHPLLQLLAHTKFFSSGHKWSGFDVQSAAVYRGRGEFKVSALVSEGKAKKASGEAVRRQTLAERKAANATNQKEVD
jgi:preprotein translocase subunit SecD